MSRFTTKKIFPSSNDYFLVIDKPLCQKQANNKLGKLEDWEEQLDYPLENIMPLLLAYKQGYIYIKDAEEKTTKEEIISQVGLTTDGEWCLMTIKGFVLDKDYKKTWWLSETKEE